MDLLNANKPVYTRLSSFLIENFAGILQHRTGYKVMITSDDVSGLYEKFGKSITTIDSHTEGESTSLIVDGVSSIPGTTMIRMNLLSP